MILSIPLDVIVIFFNLIVSVRGFLPHSDIFVSPSALVTGRVCLPERSICCIFFEIPQTDVQRPGPEIPLEHHAGLPHLQVEKSVGFFSLRHAAILREKSTESESQTGYNCASEKANATVLEGRV